MKKYFIFTVIIAALLLTTPLFAEDEDGKFYGSFLIGFRMTDIDGSNHKYMQHYNLDEGSYLSGFNFTYEPANDMKKVFDYLSVNLSNFGGQPFEAFNLNMTKYGYYSFKYQRRNALYFYEDIYLGDHPDWHSYDFERTIDNASLSFNLSKNLSVLIGFDRYEKTGNSVTTLDFEHDEFEFDKPVNEVKNEYSFGLNYNANGFSFSFEERIRDYENTNSLFLPGAALGEDPADVTILNYLFSDMPYDFMSYSHTARIVAKPNKWLIFRGAMTLEDLEMNLDYDERADGTEWRVGDPYVYHWTGNGKIDRTIGLYDFDVSLLLSDSLAVVAAYRFNDFEQEGSVTVDGDETMRDYMFSTTGMEAGLQYQFSNAFTASAGLRLETRDVEHEGADTFTTEQTGFYGNLAWNPCRTFSLTGDFQMGSYDDPYTLASPTDMTRFKVSARSKLGKKFFASASYMNKMLENENSDWTLDQNSLNLRLGYHAKGFYASAGYRMLMVEQGVTRNLVFYGRPATWEVLYEGTTNIIDGYMKWNINKNWTLGGYLSYLDNQDTWPISRMDLNTFLKYKFCNGFLVKAGYRYIDYEEADEHLNDYSAGIAEFGIGYVWY